MLSFAGDSTSRSIRMRIGVMLLGALALLLALPARAQVVATYDFEDGTAQGWTSFNGASVPQSSTAVAYSGTHSLLTAAGASGSGGPSLSVTSNLLAGATYSITGWVRLASGEGTGNANFTMRVTDTQSCSGTCYTTVGGYQIAVNESGWAQIGGSFQVPTTVTAMTLYAQLVGATTAESFYLDDVVITETAPPPGGTPVASYTWSDGGLDGWTPFGSATLTNAMPSPVDPVGNAHALLTGDRTATYEGPSLDLLGVGGVVAGATYQVSAYVMLANADAGGATVTLSTKTANCASAGTYNNLATSTALSNAAWTKVTGTFTFSDQPGPPASLTLYFQSSSATDSFYISDVTIGELSPGPPDPSQQDNTGISTSFEDGSLDGWSSRSGSSTLTNTTAEANGGSHSLQITNRQANWDGPSINVSDKMYVGSVYNISVWVRLAPTDGTSHFVNVSLQTTYQGATSYPGVTGYPGVSVPADGAWHQIVVNNYTMGSNYDAGAATLYVQTATSDGSNDLIDFNIDDFQLTYVAPPQIQTSIPSIYKTYANYFPIGAAVDMTDLSGPHQQLLTMHFNSITSGNDFKWQTTEPSLGSYDWTNADAEAGLAVCHGMKIRGHNLVWANGSQVPSYAFGDGTNSPQNQETVTANIQEHIKTEVQHFGSEVYAWDVVNEPIDPNQPDCLVHGPFYNVLGKSYIDVALQAARQYAPPGTKLFINDYSLSDPNKLACLVKVVHDLRSRGIPLDGIGHETHSAINYPTVDAMRTSFDTVARNFPGLDQQVTELDISVYNGGDSKSNYGNNVPPAVLAEQGWLYKNYFDLFRQERHRLTGVTLWGMADDDTWLDSFPVSRTDYPLPFDMGLQAKPAYWGIVDPTHLPGYGLRFALTSVAGSRTAQTWTVTATNGSAGPAYTTEIASFTLRQVTGAPCSATITPPGGSFPVALGDIPAGGRASVPFTLTFRGCGPLAGFVLQAPWTQATYHTGTLLGVADPYFRLAF